MPELYVGLMSGTSLDGIDAVLADFQNERPLLLSHQHVPFPEMLHTELAALNHSGEAELLRSAIAANALAMHYADAVDAVLAEADVSADDVQAIGCHGQTVRHQPDDGYTIQLVNAALLCELCDITVACDFRSRDIAAGGQGAPLAPAFHHAAFASDRSHRVIINIGGIANVTDLPPTMSATGFDCGPGNGLMDGWMQRHQHQNYDAGGAWAASGTVLPELLTQLMADDYFARLPPKSTGRELFNIAWLEKQLTGEESPASVQSTLLALSAQTISDAMRTFCPGAEQAYICGGGARNDALMKLLAAQLAPIQVAATDELGVQAEHVEALAFAWLARQTVKGIATDLAAVTGARGPRILGALYPK